MIRNRLLWIVLGALGVRLGFILWAFSGAYISPQVYLSERYFQEGYALSAGWGYSADEEPLSALTPNQQKVERGELNPGTGVPRPAGFYWESLHPPGMSAVVAALHRLFGGDAGFSWMLLGALLDTAAAAILYLMVKAVWSEPVAFIAGLTYALFLPQAFAVTADRLPNGLVSFFVIAAFACVLRGVRPDEKQPYLWFAAAGFIVGLGGYLRPDYDLLAVGLFPFLWLYIRNFWKATTAAVVMLALTCVTLLPWAHRNHELYGSWTFTSSAVGSTLVQGLGEFSNPWGVGYSDAWLVHQAKAHGFKSAYTMDADNYFYGVFSKDVREHPLAFFGTIGKRLPLTLAPAHLFGFANPLKTKTFTQQREAGLDRYQTLLKKPFYVLGAYWDALLFAAVSLVFLLCSLCMLWAERSQLPLVALLMAPHIYGIGTHLPTDAEPRYLLPSMFSLMIGFAYCVVTARSRVSRTVPRRSSIFVRSTSAELTKV